MARKSSELAQVNAGMARKLLAAEPDPVPEGGYGLRVLETTGRRSGEARQTPLGVLLLGGTRYLVSPDANRDWVRNLVATPQCRVRAGGVDENVCAQPVDGADAVSVISAYLNAVRAPWALAAFPVGPAASAAEIAARLDSLAVFRLEPGAK
ncbi:MULTISPECIES: nitroreductase family deazaflavin-dependent oxidoreductase [Amycolatopsis]|uniref:Nitroreductase family deazaflavin-dependent oxidoreductase n=1 Tax=Amycolatopsis dendrobii TaxID=2760662 RepID=A0A7W3VYI8_9PSEU|nr:MULTISPECIES: nitroreductase family deazaflavin-dependent oxidoreductase [Amycolatopsis]MBB1155389.1 nitroreductase family deazaflavin-dependent oxidoreductase [Amycolatopsis dendrobii]UKD54674.1 nitroreductase family deazaflavin-dependent oxidoreductase [Amycolatopsis sp. FU40]